MGPGFIAKELRIDPCQLGYYFNHCIGHPSLALNHSPQGLQRKVQDVGQDNLRHRSGSSSNQPEQMPGSLLPACGLQRWADHHQSLDVTRKARLNLPVANGGDFSPGELRTNMKGADPLSEGAWAYLYPQTTLDGTLQTD